MLSIETLQERVANSELGQEWINDPLLNRDIWAYETLGYTEEETKIRGIRNIYFTNFSLLWLKLLAKLTIKASAKERCSLNLVHRRIVCLRQLDNFLLNKGYNQPEIITDTLLQEFIFSGTRDRQLTISYVVKLWKEERWLNLPYIHRKRQAFSPKLEIIPEEVLHYIYENFDWFPPPLERLFKLQLVLGCRIGELLKMPRRCLKREDNKWFLKRWIQKRKHWQFYQIHFLVAELVREQQKFLDLQFGSDSDFKQLFCKLSTASRDIASRGKRAEIEPVYLPEILSSSQVYNWIRDFREKIDLKDKFGNKFKLTSHMFRRTKASIMAYCEAEDEYIAAVLGHSSLDMLPHYRQRSLERLEKEADTKGYVDMYGRVTSFKPRKRRYERLSELLKVSTSLGECHRPTMLGDCQYRHACLSCDHHRVTVKDKPILEIDIQSLQKDLEQAQSIKQERRVTEINRLLDLLKIRLEGLEKLQSLKERTING